MPSSSSKVEKTPDELDEELIRELEQKIEEVLELLSTQKDVDQSLDELTSKHHEKRKHTGDSESTWLQHKKHKNIAVSKHSQTNLDLIEAWKQHKQFMEHPKDLLKHLDRLTERLLNVVERYSKRGKKIKLPDP
jgi:hypothetical protein